MANYTYTVTDSATGAAITNAEVTYNYNIPGGWFGVGGGAGNGSGYTDTNGQFSFVIDGYNSGGTFSYSVQANGYWAVNGQSTEGTITGDIDHAVTMNATSTSAPPGQGLASTMTDEWNALSGAVTGTVNAIESGGVYVLAAFVIIAIAVIAVVLVVR